VEVIPDAAIAAIVASVEPSSTVVATSTLTGGLSSWMTTIDVERPDGSRMGLLNSAAARGAADHPDAICALHLPRLPASPLRQRYSLSRPK
jgi:hypothetical protein